MLLKDEYIYCVYVYVAWVESSQPGLGYMAVT